MTPELKTACEVVFQEHKVSTQIKWSKDAFRGRISIGLSELAKEILVRKNVIFLPDKSKKIITLLNPAVAAAASFEEAEEIIVNKVNKAPEVVTKVADDRPAYIPRQVSGLNIPRPRPAYSQRLLPVAGKPETRVAEVKWYMRPLFFYIVWPLCAVVAGALIAYLIDFAYTELFLNPS
jgi:hypothetical protein